MSSRFKYLPYVIIFAIFVYLLLVSIEIIRFHYRRLRQSTESARSSSFRETLSSLWTSEDIQTHDFYRINILWRDFIMKHGWVRDHQSIEIMGMYGLLIYRLACFIYFFSVPFVWCYEVNNGGGAHYFTIWNIDLITLYFACLTCMSVLGVIYDKDLRSWTSQNRTRERGEPSSVTINEITVIVNASDSAFLKDGGTTNDTIERDNFWSERVKRIVNILSIIHDVAGSSALFVTIVAFILLDPRFAFWNTNIHFINSLSLVVDGIFNPLIVYEKHLVFHLTWVFLYISFAWLLVGNHGLTNWPYFFLDSSTPIVFIWYSVLYVFFIFVFFMWMGLNQIKVSISTVKWCCCRSQMLSNVDELNNEIKHIHESV